VSPAKRERREALRAETRRAVAALEADGVRWSDWARERGFALHAVKDVVRDRNPATRGELFAVASRIRQEARLTIGPPRKPTERIRDLELSSDRLDSRLGKVEAAVAELRATVPGPDLPAPASEFRSDWDADYADFLIAAVKASGRSGRDISMAAVGHDSAVRNLTRGQDLRMDTFFALCRELGIEICLRTPGEPLEGP
jgi:hypothetical protein